METLDDKANASVFAGLIDRRTAEVYELRKKGVLPPDGASYRETISSYVAFLQQKAAGRNDTAETKARLQKAGLDKARTESTWLDVKAKRSLLVDKYIFTDVLTGGFVHLRDELLHIAHEHPEVADKIMTALKGLAKYGRHLATESEQSQDNVLAEQLKDIDDSINALDD